VLRVGKPPILSNPDVPRRYNGEIMKMWFKHRLAPVVSGETISDFLKRRKGENNKTVRFSDLPP
jgi:hypothetical protein